MHGAGKASLTSHRSYLSSACLRSFVRGVLEHDQMMICNVRPTLRINRPTVQQYTWNLTSPTHLDLSTSSTSDITPLLLGANRSRCVINMSYIHDLYILPLTSDIVISDKGRKTTLLIIMDANGRDATEINGERCMKKQFSLRTRLPSDCA